jgi:hypothetical protein
MFRAARKFAPGWLLLDPGKTGSRVLRRILTSRPCIA